MHYACLFRPCNHKNHHENRETASEGDDALNKQKRKTDKTPCALKNELKDLRPIYFLFLTVAGVVNAIGVTMFLYPVKLYDSGISGTSMLLDQITPDHYELSMFLLLLNIPIFLFGMKNWRAPIYCSAPSSAA